MIILSFKKVTSGFVFWKLLETNFAEHPYIKYISKIAFQNT